MRWDGTGRPPLSFPYFPPPPLPPSLFPLVPAEKAGSERPFFASKFLCRKFFGEFLLSAGAGPLLLGTLSLEAFPSRSSLPNDVGRRRRPLPPFSSQQLSLFQTAGGGKRGRIERRTLNLNLSLSFLPPFPLSVAAAAEMWRKEELSLSGGRAEGDFLPENFRFLSPKFSHDKCGCG